MNSPLLTASEAAARLGWSRRTFYNHRHTHQIKSMRSPNAIGIRVYVAALVDAYNAGQTTTRLIKRSA